MTPRPFAPRAAVAAFAVLLAACGGGGSGGDTPVPSRESAQAVSADGAQGAADAAAAADALVEATHAAVAGGQSTQTVACPGGGSATYTVTGGSVLELTNRRLDPGERYTITAAACRGAAGAPAVSGRLTVEVVDAGDTRIELQTTTQGVIVTLPRSSVALDGGSTLTRSLVSAGGTTTRITGWTAREIDVVRTRGARVRSLALTDVDLERRVVFSGGLPVSTTLGGSATVERRWPDGRYAVTLAIDGGAVFDAQGRPSAGRWTLDLPADRLTLEIAGGTARVDLDVGANGSIDRSWSWPLDSFEDAAG